MVRVTPQLSYTGRPLPRHVVHCALNCRLTGHSQLHSASRAFCSRSSSLLRPSSLPQLPPLSNPALRLLDTPRIQDLLRGHRVRLSLAFFASPGREPIRCRLLCCAVLLHRLRPQRGNLHHPHSFIRALSGNNDAAARKLSSLGLTKSTILAIFITADVVATLVAGRRRCSYWRRPVESQVPDHGEQYPARWPCLPGLLVSGLPHSPLQFLRNSKKVMMLTGMGNGERGGVMMAYTTALVVSLLLVYLWTIFGLAEKAEGIGVYASSHEPLFGVLEFAPLVVAMALLGWWHPGRVVGATMDCRA